MRADLEIIHDWIPAGSRVLDLGCGSGELLASLRDRKQVTGYGLEIDPDNIAACVDEMLRVGRQCIITFPNFGHWRCRWYLATKGRMPVSDFMPYTWYNTPNIHFCTFADFEELVHERRAKVLDRLAVDHQHRNGWGGRLWPNLLGEIGIYRVSSPNLQERQLAV